MKPATLPLNEAARLVALHMYQVLDTPPETSFDEITQLAASICQTPIALVSLIDAERQWFKSAVGLDVQETHRDLAFCAHAILDPDQLLIVEDTLKDERFVDNPLVTGAPHIRFYAGWPLTNPSGNPLGTLCIIDREPRQLSQHQRHALRILGNQVMIQLELRQALNHAHKTKDQLSEYLLQREQLIQKLTESNTELDRFAYVASHDLQEPLRTIYNFSSIMVGDYAKTLDSEGLEYLTQVANSVLRMQHMVDDLLDYARIENNNAIFAAIDTEKLFVHALNNLAVSIEESKADITHEVLPVLQGNSLQFMRLMQNIMANSIKYQKPDMRPIIHVGVEEQPDHWHFSISDNGIGIESEYRDAIFEPFRRLHSWDEYRGSGMGLSVCKKIVENHGGKIWVASHVNKGSVFHFTIAKVNKEQV